jgi:hypothetical protein
MDVHVLIEAMLIYVCHYLSGLGPNRHQWVKRLMGFATGPFFLELPTTKEYFRPPERTKL